MLETSFRKRIFFKQLVFKTKNSFYRTVLQKMWDWKPSELLVSSTWTPRLLAVPSCCSLNWIRFGTTTWNSKQYRLEAECESSFFLGKRVKYVKRFRLNPRAEKIWKNQIHPEAQTQQEEIIPPLLPHCFRNFSTMVGAFPDLQTSWEVRFGLALCCLAPGHAGVGYE